MAPDCDMIKHKPLLIQPPSPPQLVKPNHVTVDLLLVSHWEQFDLVVATEGADGKQSENLNDQVLFLVGVQPVSCTQLLLDLLDGFHEFLVHQKTQSVLQLQLVHLDRIS